MKSQKYNFILLICLFNSILITDIYAQKSLTASKIESEIKIDGHLDEVEWQNKNSVAQDFMTMRPKPGLTPAHPTEVQLRYDDEALYISAVMYEASRDSIMSQLMKRDQIGNTDFIGVIIDTYGNSNSAFEFILSSTGVQFDAKVTPNNEDSNWDAVWFGQVQLQDDNWTAEIKIPYAAIRFPKQAEQNWNINFFRRRAINGEQSVWTDFDPELSNPWLTQMGKVDGIRNIKPPVRLSFSPYASVYGIQSHDKKRDPINSLGSSYNLGLDLKYGINDAFTLDMTLIPDFGQVQSDDVILNLSPFEQRFSERRPFFTEGLEIFNKGNIFYSRRVGNNQQLYNASKISGRTKNGLGIGIFNAVAAEKSSIHNIGGEEIENVELPLTNYNIAVFDKDLKNNSSISLTNTNVYRWGSDFHNANVTATSFTLKNKKQSFDINGTGGISQLLHKNSEDVMGYSINVGVNKIDGALIGGLYYQDISKTYDANDLGYSIFANQRVMNLYGTYRMFKGFGPFNNFNIFSNASYARNVIPSAFANVRANLGFYGQTKAQHYINFWSTIQSTSNDFYEPRVEDRYYVFPRSGGAGYYIGTDDRKKFKFQTYGNIFKYDREGWFNYSIGTTERFRFNDKLNAFIDISFSADKNAIGFASHSNENEIIFGNRNRNTISNVIGSNYTFNDRMGLNFRLRHYWSKVKYNEYYALNNQGGLNSTSYNEFNNLSYNIFSIDLNFNWQFAPGSELNITWKNNIAGADSNPIIDYSTVNYRDGVRSLSDFPQTNSLSLRMVYFLDYSSQIKKVFK